MGGFFPLAAFFLLGLSQRIIFGRFLFVRGRRRNLRHQTRAAGHFPGPWSPSARGEPETLKFARGLFFDSPFWSASLWKLQPLAVQGTTVLSLVQQEPTEKIFFRERYDSSLLEEEEEGTAPEVVAELLFRAERFPIRRPIPSPEQQLVFEVASVFPEFLDQK